MGWWLKENPIAALGFYDAIGSMAIYRWPRSCSLSLSFLDLMAARMLLKIMRRVGDPNQIFSDFLVPFKWHPNHPLWHSLACSLCSHRIPATAWLLRLYMLI